MIYCPYCGAAIGALEATLRERHIADHQRDFHRRHWD